MWVLCLGALLVVVITHWVYRWRNPKCNGELPPGSLGLPLLGETFHFFTPHTSSDLHPFVKDRMNRYGPIFKTNLVGRATVVSTDPDFNYFIFQQEGQLFESWYPESFIEIFGRENLSSLHGFLFKYLKNMVLNLFGPEGLKRMISEVEQKACTTLQAWSSKETMELKYATRQMVLELTAKKLLSCDSAETLKSLMDSYVELIDGLISFPTNIPRTSYYKCMQGRKRVMKILKELLQERRERPNKQRMDFFDYVLQELGKEGTLITESIALDLMFVLLFASFETTSLALTYGIKALCDNPLVLKHLQARSKCF